MGSCFGLCIIFCLLSLAGGGEGAGQGTGTLHGENSAWIFSGRGGKSGEGYPLAIPHYSPASPPGAVGAVAGGTGAHVGVGVTGCTPSCTEDGGCRRVGTTRVGAAREGGSCSVVAGFGAARWGAAPLSPGEVPAGREGAGKCRRWGGKGESGREGTLEV